MGFAVSKQRLFLAGVLAGILSMGVVQAQEGLALEDVLETVLEQDSSGLEQVLIADPLDSEPLGDRQLVVVVHGIADEFLDVPDEPHNAWMGFRAALGLHAVNPAAFAKKKIFYYQYRPDKPYDQLGADFAGLIQDEYPGKSVLVVAHSAGALLARHASRYLEIEAVIGIAPAHGGAQGASLMLANDGLFDRIGEEHRATMEAARQRFGVSDEVIRSLAWENKDGAISSADQANLGIPVAQDLPPITYRHFDYYGILENFHSSIFNVFTGDAAEAEQEQREWEALKAYSDVWALNDGILAPYDAVPGPVDGEGGCGEVQFFKGLRHREVLFAPILLRNAVNRIDQVIAGNFPDCPSFDPPADEPDDADDVVTVIDTQDDEPDDEPIEETKKVTKKKKVKKKGTSAVNNGTVKGDMVVVGKGGTYMKDVEVNVTIQGGDEDLDEGDLEDVAGLNSWIRELVHDTTGAVREAAAEADED